MKWLWKFKREIWIEDKLYLIRYYLISKNKYFNIYLHHILTDDFQEYYHDHPFKSLSIVLYPGYIEERPDMNTSYDFGYKVIKQYYWKPGAFIYHPALEMHCINLYKDKPSWSLFITGPIFRQWGFNNGRGWIAEDEYKKGVRND